MINTATVTKALVAQLIDNLPLTTADGRPYRVERGQSLNITPDASPWIGVYREPVRYEPRSLGRGPRHLKAFLTFRILILASTEGGGVDLDDLIGEYVKDVLDALQADHTIGGNVDAIMEYEIEQLFEEEEPGSEFSSWAVITLSAEANSQ